MSLFLTFLLFSIFNATALRENWAILVAGGDSNRIFGSEIGNLPHVLQICDAYNVLAKRLARDHIIVIARLNDMKDLLFQSNQTEPWREIKRNQFNESCRNLILNGGADYDGSTVNPTTLLKGTSSIDKLYGLTFFQNLKMLFHR